MAAEESNVLSNPDSQALNVIADNVNGLTSLKAAEEATQLLKTKRDELMLEELAPQTSAPAPPPAPAPKYPRARISGCTDCPFNDGIEITRVGETLITCDAMGQARVLDGATAKGCPIKEAGAVIIALKE